MHQRNMAIFVVYSVTSLFHCERWFYDDVDMNLAWTYCQAVTDINLNLATTLTDWEWLQDKLNYSVLLTIWWLYLCRYCMIVWRGDTEEVEVKNEEQMLD